MRPSVLIVSDTILRSLCLRAEATLAIEARSTINSPVGVGEGELTVISAEAEAQSMIAAAEAKKCFVMIISRQELAV